MSYITMPCFANVRIFTLSYIPIMQHILPRRHFNSHILPIPSTRRHEIELCIYDTTRQNCHWIASRKAHYGEITPGWLEEAQYFEGPSVDIG